LPPGTWYDGVTGAVEDGDRVLRLRRRLKEVPPHFVRAGTLVVRQPYSLKASTVPQTLSLHWYDVPDALDTFVLYEDDGLGNGYESGECSRTTFHTRREGDELTITISPDDGHYRGRPEHRSFVVHLHGTSALSADGAEPGEGDIWTARPDGRCETRMVFRLAGHA
jgi:alpha-glucosidase (family GH31 glycosyl hydrolase)